MANRASTRNGSRRTTPQPVPESTIRMQLQSSPKRSTRATRSQSAVSDSEGSIADAKGRRPRKEAPSSKRSTRIAGKSDANGRKGGPSDSSEGPQNLSTVVEAPDIDYPNLESEKDENADEGVEEVGSVEQRVTKDPLASERFSNVSGTTARTSRSAQDLVDIIPETLLDALPDLDRESDRLLKLLIPSEISESGLFKIRKEMRDENSWIGKTFSRYGNTFQTQRKEYASGPFITPLNVLGTLLDVQETTNVPTGPWRPDPILQKSNLAMWCSNILAFPWNVDEEKFEGQIEQAFPGMFMGVTNNPGHSKAETNAIDQATFQIALELRTQYALGQLSHYSRQRNFDYGEILSQVFFEGKKTLKGWDKEGWRSKTLTTQARQSLMERVKKIEEICHPYSEDPTELVRQVRIAFPWASFAQHALTWISQRLGELREDIGSRGGPDNVVQSLREEMIRRQASRSIENNHDIIAGVPQLELHYEPPPDLPLTTSINAEKPSLAKSIPTKLYLAGFSTNSPKAKSAAAHLKRRAARRSSPIANQQAKKQQDLEPNPEVQARATTRTSARASTPQRSASSHQVPSHAPANALNDQGPAVQDDDWMPANGEDDDIIQGTGASGTANDDDEAAERRAIIQGVVTAAAQNEADSNKENEATDVAPQTRGYSKRHITDRQPNASRVEWDSQESESRDQQDQMSDASEDEGFQTQDPPADLSLRPSSDPARKRPAPASAQGNPPKRVHLQQDRQSAMPRGPRGSASLVRGEHEDMPMLTQAMTYIEANSSAKERVAKQPKKVQTRRQWSEIEIETLIDLIGKFGTSWAELKREDSNSILENRDQVALKDKARNMKVDYLKAGRWMPLNFEKICISNIQIEQLKAAGIRYRKETGHRVDGRYHG